MVIHGMKNNRDYTNSLMTNDSLYVNLYAERKNGVRANGVRAHEYSGYKEAKAHETANKIYHEYAKR